jgi:hypothetical protein
MYHPTSYLVDMVRKLTEEVTDLINDNVSLKQKIKNLYSLTEASPQALVSATHPVCGNVLLGRGQYPASAFSCASHSGLLCCSCTYRDDWLNCRTGMLPRPEFHPLGLQRYLILHSLIYSLMELSPSWEAANCAASQRFTEPEGSLSRSQESSTSPYPEPDRSKPYHPILSLQDPFKYCPPTYVLVFPVVSFFLDFPPISYMQSSSPHSCYMPCPSHPPW